MNTKHSHFINKPLWKRVFAYLFDWLYSNAYERCQICGGIRRYTENVLAGWQGVITVEGQEIRCCYFCYQEFKNKPLNILLAPKGKE